MAQDNEIDRQHAGTHFSAAAPAEGFEVLLITGMSGAGRAKFADSNRSVAICWRQLHQR